MTLLVVCGDFSARIGNEADYVTETDDVRTRVVLHHVKVGHCSAFLDFLKESKLLIVNGRVTPEFDTYKSIAARGSAVVDYILTPQETLSAGSVMKVHPVSDLVEKYSLRGLISESYKPPDHAYYTQN